MVVEGRRNNRLDKHSKTSYKENTVTRTTVKHNLKRTQPTGLRPYWCVSGHQYFAGNDIEGLT